jgi:hypothetical protein
MSKNVAQAYALLNRDRSLAASALNLQPGHRALVTNGKVAHTHTRHTRHTRHTIGWTQSSQTACA